MSTRIEVIVVCTDDESPEMLLKCIPAGALVKSTVARGTRPCSTPRIVNAAMQRVREERGDPWLWVIVHPDVELPDDFFPNLTHWTSQLYRLDPHYGVIGAMGVRLQDGKRWNCGHLWDRTYEAGAPLDGPCLVDALDEVLVVLRGDRPWTLDDSMGTYHLWASELCLREKHHGRNSYVLPGMFIRHHSTSALIAPDDPYFWYNLGVLSERYRAQGTTLVTPSGTVYDNRDDAGVRLC